ncbi:ribonuclease inhibitor-like isoform X2 [Nelusetta ayraudi]|uniref:ribonuclease inhibitor-like isoform X2 n=1 Tax=Nelusetta ayraudi TaxID=303726 RepID=UPI003F6FB6EB
MDVEEVRPESPGPSTVSLKSDRSICLPPVFSHEPGPSETRVQGRRRSSESPGSSMVSLKSDNSKGVPPLFSNEPGPSETQYGIELSELQCAVVSSALQSSPSHLPLLDLSLNTLKDPGVKLLCAGLQSPNCRLEVLRLESCRLSELSCDWLLSALKSNRTHLRHLDLSGNQLKASSVKPLMDLVHSRDYQLESVRWR